MHNFVLGLVLGLIVGIVLAIILKTVALFILIVLAAVGVFTIYKALNRNESSTSGG